jgi:hypothetical protein
MEQIGHQIAVNASPGGSVRKYLRTVDKSGAVWAERLGQFAHHGGKLAVDTTDGRAERFERSTRRGTPWGADARGSEVVAAGKKCRNEHLRRRMVAQHRRSHSTNPGGCRAWQVTTSQVVGADQQQH